MTEQKNNEVMVIEEVASAIETSPVSGILTVIERCALNPAVDPAKMSQLFDLQERMMDKQAYIEYIRAFAQMQPNLPPIPAMGEGHNSAKFAKKEDMNHLVNPVLSQYGFALSFRNTQENGSIKTVATLMHNGGHSESTEVILKDDSSGSKNAVQAVGSSMSYGERYTMKAILNLTIIKDPTDDDAKTATSSKSGNKSANTDKFAAKVKADAKKPEKTEVDENAPWDKKSLYFPEGAKKGQFVDSKDAAKRLYTELKKFKTKAERRQVVNMNLALIKSLVLDGNGAVIENLHKLADEVK